MAPQFSTTVLFLLVAVLAGRSAATPMTVQTSTKTDVVECPYCAEHEVCAGTGTDKRCVTPMPEGKPCGQDPFWVCEEGLICEDGTCQKPPIKEGESCLGAESDCDDGLVCAGTDDKKKCVKPMTEGKPCGQDPFWICADGLVCAGGHEKKCVVPMDEGEKCGQDPYWVCAEHLNCVYNICSA